MCILQINLAITKCSKHDDMSSEEVDSTEYGGVDAITLVASPYAMVSTSLDDITLHYTDQEIFSFVATEVPMEM